MGLFNLNFFSKNLMVYTQVNVLMPEILRDNDMDAKSFYGSGCKYKVLFLLHGSTGDCYDWIKNSNIARYAAARDLVVVMPSVLNSDYSNYSSFADGFNVRDYIIDELMPLIHGWLPVSDKKEDNYICGMSMGGNGTLLLALQNSQLFGGVAVLSSTAREVEYLRPYSALSSEQFRNMANDKDKFPGPNGNGMRAKEINQIAKYPYVKDFLSSFENSWDRLAEIKNKESLPQFYFACGTSDKNVYPRFLRFKKYCSDLNLPFVFEEFEGYKHEWSLWDITIKKALDFFGLEDLGERY